MCMPIVDSMLVMSGIALGRSLLSRYSLHILYNSLVNHAVEIKKSAHWHAFSKARCPIKIFELAYQVHGGGNIYFITK